MDETKPPLRILLKLSGEMLAGGGELGIRPQIIGRMAEEIAEVRRAGIEVALVIGGGNIFRGVAGASRGMDRAQADYMGMLATVINGMALQDALEQRDCMTRLMTAITMPRVAEPYIRRRAIRHMEKGRAVILAAGTGNPFFSTDTAAALRAVELQADMILKGTKVAGVYDDDPVKNPEARLYKSISYLEVIQRKLRVMDITAISMCMENSIPLVVFDITQPGNLKRVLQGEPLGTRVTGDA